MGSAWPAPVSELKSMMSSVRRLAAMTAVAVTVGVTLGLTPVALSAPPAGAAAAGGSFGRGFALSLPRDAASYPYGPDAFITSLSCPSFGNCDVGGAYIDKARHGTAMVIEERSGRWSRGVALRMPHDAPANVLARVKGIACPRPGVCVAVGEYPPDTSPFGVGRVFAGIESGGRWLPAHEITLPVNAASPPSGELNAVSCTAPGSCLAIGDYTDKAGDIEAMTVKERNGRWGRAFELYPTSDAAQNPRAKFNAITCQPNGQCVMVGTYVDNAGKSAILGLIESHGNWLSVQRIALPANTSQFLNITSVSCAGAGACVIVGGYGPQALAAVESGLTFKPARLVTAVPPNESGAVLYAVSCTASGQCVAVGNYTDTTNREHSYAVIRAATGHWVDAALVRTPPGASTGIIGVNGLFAISCVIRGCVAAGFYTHSSSNYPWAAIRK
jgi:hypothetical protein